LGFGGSGGSSGAIRAQNASGNSSFAMAPILLPWLRVADAGSQEDTDWFAEKGEWAGLRSFIMVEAEREVLGQGATVERRYFVSSLPADAKQALRAVRGHWQVENSLHWVLDVAFRTPSEGLTKYPTAERYKSDLRLFFGFCRLPKDGDPYQRGLGMSPDDMTLGLLADKKIVEKYLESQRVHSWQACCAILDK
jgi:hypothetical protein